MKVLRRITEAGGGADRADNGCCGVVVVAPPLGDLYLHLHL